MQERRWEEGCGWGPRLASDFFADQIWLEEGGFWPTDGLTI